VEEGGSLTVVVPELGAGEVVFAVGGDFFCGGVVATEGGTLGVADRLRFFSFLSFFVGEGDPIEALLLFNS